MSLTSQNYLSVDEAQAQGNKIDIVEKIGCGNFILKKREKNKETYKVLAEKGLRSVDFLNLVSEEIHGKVLEKVAKGDIGEVLGFQGLSERVKGDNEEVEDNSYKMSKKRRGHILP